jgi:hypothetical protein
MKNKFFILLFLNAFLFINNICAQGFYPYSTDEPKVHKKKQKEIPRFPPQFRAKDTVGGKQSPAFVQPKPVVVTPPSKQYIPPTTVVQAAPKAPKKSDTTYKVISSKIDAGGNEVKNVDMIVGIRKWNYTYITPNASQLNKIFSADSINKDSITILVVKKNFRMYVYHKHRFLTSYKCVFGPDYMNQKQQEGDRRTPEGTFKISMTKGHADWVMFMLIDYPNAESYKNFQENIRTHAIPATARIGGAVGIHAVWEDADMVVDTKHNWTDGCIAMKRNDILELNKLIKIGTPITIKKADKDYK